MGLYEINEKLKIARQRGFKFNQKTKLAIKSYSHHRYINISYYRKHRIPIMHRQNFEKISLNPDYVQTDCKDRNNPFHFACRRWFLFNKL